MSAHPHFADVEYLLDGFEHVETRDDFRERLNAGRPLNVKLGIDPTSPDLHLGFMVVLEKLQRFSEAGHRVTWIIGDFTARIGDPSGKNVTRPQLSPAEIQANMETYRRQAATVLDLDRIEVRYNSEWLDKLGLADLVKLLAQTTVAQMLERNDFHDRYGAGSAISLHEFLLSGRAGIRFDCDRGRRGTRRQRSTLQPAARAPLSTGVWPAAADLRDRAAARRTRRAEEDEQNPRQLRRHHRTSGRAVR